LEVSLGDELGQRRLLEPRLAIAHLRLEEARFVPANARQRRVADAQPGADRFRERADVENTPAAIEPRQGREWRAVVAKVAIIVVLDDVAVRLLCPAEQRQAAIEREHDAGRKLM